MIERPYQPTDLPAVMETYTASIHSLAAPYYSLEQIVAWAPGSPVAARWEERLSHLHTIVAESGGILAGYVSYTAEGYLDLLFINPTFARRGVGSSLYRRVESTLRTAGVERIQLMPVSRLEHSSTITASRLIWRSWSNAAAFFSADFACLSNSGDGSA